MGGRQMVTLQQHLSSNMEETVRTLLQNHDSLEGPKVDPLDLMKAYKDKLLEEMWKQQDSLDAPIAPAAAAETPGDVTEGGGALDDGSKDSNSLLERLRALEAENSALSMENDNQRKQYERCLDEVANQVVQALLTQKNLKEECVKLRTRVFDLEQQNRILSVLFQQRVKMSPNPISQEVQRNGKASIPAGRWPSLLSLTCPRSSGSGSGSELSLSSACSEYSSGSHTWAEGRGSSKQCAAGRDKRMSACSVSSNHSVPMEQTEIGWKEGHIIKGLKRLQMSNSKEVSPPASAPHCKDCMTSNEGIYSLGVKWGQPGSSNKHVPPTTKSFKTDKVGITALDSDDADEDLAKSQNVEFVEQPREEILCLEKLDVTRDGENNFQGDSDKVTDNFLFSEDPTVKPLLNPTDSLIRLDEKNNSLDKHKTAGNRLSDRNNNQERSTDRKSRLDYIKRQQGRLTNKQVETERNVPHSAAVVLSCESVTRQRSSSMEVPHCRDQEGEVGNQSHNYTISEYSKRKPKPQPCDSARKAFILRSKSADGGPEQQKHMHSPLHQKLFKSHRPNGQSNASGNNVPSRSTNLSTPHASSKGAMSKVDKDEDPAVATGSKSLKSVQQRSPLASPVKHSKTFKPQGINDSSKSPKKTPLQITRHPSSNSSMEESIYDNLPCSPRKQRRQDCHDDVSHSEPRSPSPPPPPGRTTSLLLRSNNGGSLPRAHKGGRPTQSSSTGMIMSSPTRSNQFCSNIQPPKPTVDHPNVAPQVGVEAIPSKGYNTHSKIPSVQLQESKAPGSVQLPAERIATHHNENGALPLLPNQSVLQRSLQSVSEPKLTEVLPHVYSNVYYHGIPNHLQSSTARAVKVSLPVNAKSHEAISGQETSTFLVIGRQNKDDIDSATKSGQTFQTFTCEPHIIRECGAHENARRKIETRCNSLDSEPSVQPVPNDSGVMLDWGFDEEGWLFKRSVSVSTRPPLKPIMGMNGAKARSQSFGARYMDRPSFNRSGKVRTQIKTHSGSSLNSLSDVLPGSMSCSSSYHCPMNRSLLNNFLIEEGLTVPQHLGSSSERLQSLKLQREQARRLQIEQQFSSAFGEPVSEEPERQSTITTIEEKVMLGIEENLHKTQEQERTNEVKQKSGSTLANWFGFRKSKLPAPSSKKVEPAKVKEEKREQKITSLLGGKQTKSDKKRDRRKSDGKECSVAMRESHDAVRSCISMPCPGMSLNEIKGHSDIIGDPKMQLGNLRAEAAENGSTVRSPNQDPVIGFGCKMRTLDSGIGTIPLPESCSFFSSILHLLPKSSSTPEQPFSPPSIPGSSSEDVSPSPLPRWRIPSGFLDGSHAGVPNSLSDSSMTHVQSVPFPTVAFLQPIQPQCQPIVTSASVCDTQSRLPRLPPGGLEPKKSTYVKSKPRTTASQQKEQTRLQLANYAQAEPGRNGSVGRMRRLQANTWTEACSKGLERLQSHNTTHNLEEKMEGGCAWLCARSRAEAETQGRTGGDF